MTNQQKQKSAPLPFARKVVISDHMDRLGLVHPSYRTENVVSLAKKVLGTPVTVGSRYGPMTVNPPPDHSAKPLLADALQEAGATDEKFLQGLRNGSLGTIQDRVLAKLAGVRPNGYPGPTTDDALLKEWVTAHKQAASEHEVNAAHKALVGKTSTLPVGFHTRTQADLRGTPPPGHIYYRNAYSFNTGRFRKHVPAAEKRGRPLTLQEMRVLTAQRRAAKKPKVEPPQPATEPPTQLSRRRYARLTLHPPEPLGETGINHHQYTDESGNVVGSMMVTPVENGEGVHVISINNAASGGREHSSGPSAMMGMLPQLQQHYPSARWVSGMRGTGFRGREGGPGKETIKIPFRPRLQRKVVKFEKNDEETRERHLADFEDKNQAAKDRYSESKSTNVRRGRHVCRGCWRHYHVKPPDGKCPDCGGAIYTVKRMSREPQRYAQRRNDFIDALRRIKSTNQQALHKIANKLAREFGFQAEFYDALHQSPQGSSPGLVQMIYNNADPKSIEAAAAWGGLTGNGLGTRILHTRSYGTDRVYEFYHQGSLMDLFHRLGRYGINESVVRIPKGERDIKGYHIMIPDKGSKMGNAVGEFARDNKLRPTVYRGFFSTIGSADQATARDQFRNTVVRQEHGGQQMSRKRYAAADPAFVAQAKEQSGGRHQDTGLTAEVFADHLQEQGIPGAEIVRAHGRRTERDIPMGSEFVGRQGVGRSQGANAARRAELKGSSVFLASHPYTGNLYGPPAVDEYGNLHPVLQIMRDKDQRLVLGVNHVGAGETDWDKGVTHWAYPSSWEEVNHLTSDFPEWARKEVINRVARYGIFGAKPSTRRRAQPTTEAPPPVPTEPTPMSRNRVRRKMEGTHASS